MVDQNLGKKAYSLQNLNFLQFEIKTYICYQHDRLILETIDTLNVFVHILSV